MEKPPVFESDESSIGSVKEYERERLGMLKERGPKVAAFAVALGLLTAQAERANALEQSSVEYNMENVTEPIDLNNPERYCDRFDARTGKDHVEFVEVNYGPNGAVVVQAEVQDGEVTRWTSETTSKDNVKQRVDCR